jgi:hypothetical protein
MAAVRPGVGRGQQCGGEPAADQRRRDGDVAARGRDLRPVCARRWGDGVARSRDDDLAGADRADRRGNGRAGCRDRRNRDNCARALNGRRGRRPRADDCDAHQSRRDGGRRDGGTGRGEVRLSVDCRRDHGRRRDCRAGADDDDIARAKGDAWRRDRRAAARDRGAERAGRRRGGRDGRSLAGHHDAALNARRARRGHGPAGTCDGGTARAGSRHGWSCRRADPGRPGGRSASGHSGWGGGNTGPGYADSSDTSRGNGGRHRGACPCDCRSERHVGNQGQRCGAGGQVPRVARGVLQADAAGAVVAERPGAPRARFDRRCGGGFGGHLRVGEDGRGPGSEVVHDAGEPLGPV